MACPFLVTEVVLLATGFSLPVFHGSDERTYHLPTILKFARELPFPSLHRYSAAQTPLFHLLMAWSGKVVGFGLERLRLVEVVISVSLSVALYRLLLIRLRLRAPEALLASTAFALSAYVFGYSFRLMTDNLALLWLVLAIERFERYRESGQLSAFATGAAMAGLAVLSRQSSAFIFLIALVYLGQSRRRVPVPVSAGVGGALILALLPTLALFLSWHGLVPVGGDPSSCGLCAGQAGGGGLHAAAGELTLALIGLYGALLVVPWRRGPRTTTWSATAREHIWALGAGVAALLLVLLLPVSPGSTPGGWIWTVAAKFPTVLGSSLLFWALIPVGAVVLTSRLGRPPARLPGMALAACFLLSTLVIRYPWQKYVDPFALLIVLLSLREGELRSRLALIRFALVVGLSLAYTFDTGAHRDLAPRRPAVALRASAGLLGQQHQRMAAKRGPRT